MPHDRVALLAPVPLEHLLDGAPVAAQQGKVAFGSRAFLVFHELDGLRDDEEVDVYIYASHGHSAGVPRVTWQARYVRHVHALNGAHPDGMRYRPPSTGQYSTDNAGYWALFWEVVALKPLAEGDTFPVHALRGYTQKRAFRKTYVPRGPVIVQAL